MSTEKRWKRLLEFAVQLPEAYEDHPWDEVVVKVRKKVFVFMGTGEPPGMSVKLKDPVLHQHALSLPRSEPTGYGLGKSGWVSIRFDGKSLPLNLLREFIEESYRVIAPKKLVAELDKSARS